jgi:KRAB domain-containing zinc finger protein
MPVSLSTCFLLFITRACIICAISSSSHEVTKHTNVYPHKCEVCEKGFINGYQLKVHALLHTGEKPFMCSTCGMAFPQKTRLSQHIRQVHTRPKGTKVQCDICRNMVAASNIWQHKKNHEGTHTDSCSVCGKTFSCRAGRIRHEKIHFDDKTHECQYCGKAFVQKANMEAHERIHTGEGGVTTGFCYGSFIITCFI